MGGAMIELRNTMEASKWANSTCFQLPLFQKYYLTTRPMKILMQWAHTLFHIATLLFPIELTSENFNTYIPLWKLQIYVCTCVQIYISFTVLLHSVHEITIQISSYGNIDNLAYTPVAFAYYLTKSSRIWTRFILTVNICDISISLDALCSILMEI